MLQILIISGAAALKLRCNMTVQYKVRPNMTVHYKDRFRLGRETFSSDRRLMIPNFDETN